MERLLFFPQPYPDESLYSLAVRYHKLIAHESYRQTSQELFGGYSRTCGSVLPCCLGSLSQRLDAAYSVDELIERFTLFPLYRPFIDEPKNRVVRATMAGNSGSGLKMSLGITASRFLKHDSFRYCESCTREDIQKYGVPYWHRIHQAIGNCSCPHHEEVLHAITFPDRADWRCMMFPTEAHGVPVMESACDAASITISKMQLWGLEHPSEVQALLAGSFLSHRLHDLGFTRAGRIRETALKAFVTGRLRCCPLVNEFQEIAQSCDWVLRLLRPRGNVVQPFKYYALCWLLGADLEQLRHFHPGLDPDPSFKDRSRDDYGISGVDEIAVEAHRSAFLRGTEPKCHDKPSYTWLYRHDRDWLSQYVEAHPILRIRGPLVDWRARDSVLARDLAEANDLLRSAEGKPQKITRAALARQVPNDHDFLRRPALFPISINLLNDLVESDHDHQIRKIQWAATNYQLTMECALSVVFRFAGIRIPRVSNAEIYHILSYAR
ncbi:TnsD family Tn7-like transposition protein [Pseudomonas sp. W5-36]|uniref:TnsD family Tn7-like transposition protein n=1 Tax=Pseudomonas sp. W5-36 TaxID=3097455 RepID=UPI00397D5CC3